MLAQRKQELAVKVVKVFVIFMGLFVLFFFLVLLYEVLMRLAVFEFMIILV